MIQFDLKYYSNKKLIETILYNTPRAICIHKMNQLATSTHRLGKFTITKTQ